MQEANDIMYTPRDPTNFEDFSGANLENANSMTLSTVQTTLTRQASNGCQITMHFREKQDEDIDCGVASM